MLPWPLADSWLSFTQNRCKVTLVAALELPYRILHLPPPSLHHAWCRFSDMQSSLSPRYHPISIEAKDGCICVHLHKSLSVCAPFKNSFLGACSCFLKIALLALLLDFMWLNMEGSKLFNLGSCRKHYAHFQIEPNCHASCCRFSLSTCPWQKLYQVQFLPRVFEKNIGKFAVSHTNPGKFCFNVHDPSSIFLWHLESSIGSLRNWDWRELLDLLGFTFVHCRQIQKCKMLSTAYFSH